MKDYIYSEIEKKWQKYWEENKPFIYLNFNAITIATSFVQTKELPTFIKTSSK